MRRGPFRGGRSYPFAWSRQDRCKRFAWTECWTCGGRRLSCHRRLLRRLYRLCSNARVAAFGTLEQELKFYEKSSIADAHIEVYFDRQRQMEALWHFDDWLFRTIPKLHVTLNDKGERQPCFPFRKDLNDIGQLLPSLIDQQRGGGNFDKLVGLYLRQIGVSGLVFPSARNDAFTRFVNGEPDDFHGWSFVDYRNAPQQEIVAFFELRPEWPWTLMIEGCDDNTPSLAAFADEFQIVMTEGFPSTNGGFAFRGLEQRIKAYQMMDSLEAAISFRLRDLDDEQIMELKTFAVSLGARDCTNFSAMVLWSLLGLAQARRDLGSFIRNQLCGHPLANLLTRCSDPPPLDEEQYLTHCRAFYSIFQGPSQLPT